MTEQALQELQRFINNIISSKERVTILEAGCGSTTYLKFKPETYVVGIDISEEQLEKNHLLDEKILGDIQTYPLPGNTYDMVVCWNVLEHVDKPEMALLKFNDALTPGGIIILSLPNLYSFKGIATKFTPHWLHVLIYRYGYGMKDAGKDGKAPFKTYLRRETSPGAIQRFAESQDLNVEYLAY